MVLLLYLFAALPLTVFSADSDKKPCKNYVDCKYNEGFFCVNSVCKNVCAGGKVSTGVDSNGVSLPCQSDYSFSGLNDKSGRKICCPKKSGVKKESVEPNIQPKILGMLCKETKDCKDGEFCSYTESTSRCGIFNCDGSYISRIKCPPEELFLAEGPEGYFCCPLIFLGKSSSSSGETSSSSSSSSGASSSSSGSSSSSSSGGNKHSSSSGAVKDYNVQIVLQTPEIVTSKNLADNVPLFKVASAFSSSGSVAAASAPIETHNYKAGEKLAFSVYVKGPSLSKPQDVSSYTVTAIANEKSSSSNSPNLRILELSVNDIIACTDLKSFLSNPIPLNVALIKQDSKGLFNAVNADTFRLKLPDTRYLSNTSGRIVLATPDTQLKSIPENKCSPAADKVCGVDNISVANCINYSCWKYSKGSPFSKECCKGTLSGSIQDEIPTTSSSSSGEVAIPKPSCNKTSKEIECKTTNKYLVPHCSNRNNPECDKDGKPICKSVSSSGVVSLEDPLCIPYSQSTDNYCKDVSSLLYANGFDPASCVTDFCNSLKSTEEKRICCTACGIVYDKAKNPNIMLDEIDQMKSCFDFNDGLCDSIRQSQSCIEGECYKKEFNSDDMKICCSKNDKGGSVIKALLKEGRLEEDKGMIYNLISVGGGNSIRIQKSSEDIIAQNFELLLPSDPGIESVIIRASIKDKKGKVKDSNVRILLFNDEDQEEKPPIATSPDKQSCNKPEISSLRVADKSKIFAVVGNSIEIPITVNDKDNDIASLKITGLPPGLKSEDVTKMPSYYYSQIKGSIKAKGKYAISVLCTDKCGKTSSLNFEIYISNPGEQILKDDGQNNISPGSSPSAKSEENENKDDKKTE